MNHEILLYLQQLELYIKNQGKKIAELERQLEELREEIVNVRNKPTMHVEKIEYKFDQLKVETLEGTLTIGLTPTDLQNVEELQISDAHLSPKGQMERSIEIEDELFHFIETDLPEIIKNEGMKLGMNVTEELIEIIKVDFQKQIPHRVAYYLQQVREKNITEPSIKEIIIKQTKQDMINGVIIYLQNLKEKE